MPTHKKSSKKRTIQKRNPRSYTYPRRHKNPDSPNTYAAYNELQRQYNGLIHSFKTLQDVIVTNDFSFIMDQWRKAEGRRDLRKMRNLTQQLEILQRSVESAKYKIIEINANMRSFSP